MAWIVTTKGFISIVEDRDNKNMLQVRARVAADILEHFPRAKIITINGADYRYRALIRRREVAKMLRDYVMKDLTYDSHFKDIALRAAPSSVERYNAYYDTWQAMAAMQDYAPYSTKPRPAKKPFMSRWAPPPPLPPSRNEEVEMPDWYLREAEERGEDDLWGIPDWDPNWGREVADDWEDASFYDKE